ncbi:hypothetical protein CsatB_013070 [Cannabis sativa]
MSDIVVKIRESSLVRPVEKTSPTRSTIPLSDLDQLYYERRSTLLYFYNNKNYNNSSSSSVDDHLHNLKEALAKTLVLYYPVAGRLSRVENGGEERLEIKCNDEGVLFVVGETKSHIEDLGDFTDSSLLISNLIPPTPDYSAGISSFPLLVFQVTYFGCGGVCLSVGGEHLAFDGHSAINFIKSWSEIFRDQPNTITPYFDRTLLNPRNPPKIMFDHTKEYQLPTQPKLSIVDEQNFKVVILKVTKDQLNKLKNKAKELVNNKHFSTFCIMSGLIWKCACIARALPKDQETRLFFNVDGRSRLQPPLPRGYFGNVVFEGMAEALAGDLQSKPLWYAVSLVHESLMRRDDDYLRSVIDFFKVNPNTKRHRLEVQCRCPNFAINSWTSFALDEADFGWGLPLGICGITINEGRASIYDDIPKNGNLCVHISLQTHHIKEIESIFMRVLEQSCSDNKIIY